ncbi:MAG TPA: hypothetical protein VLK33_07320 [Terriglobales bacterium]|nr:hypothetical protein [Terriglobales bacterium]
MRRAHLKTGLQAFLIYACVGVLLLVGTVMAAHICGLQTSQTTISVQTEANSSPANQQCAMCLLIQSVAAVLLLMVLFSPLPRRKIARPVFQVHLIPVLTSFQLYVRPPPVW